MMGREHISFGAVTGAAAGLVVFAHCGSFLTGCAFAGLTVLGSLLPDADHENSTINRVFPPAKAAYYLLGAKDGKGRGAFLHDPAFYAAVAGLMAYFQAGFVWYGILIGIAGHLLLDAFTWYGLPFLSLVNRKRLHIVPRRMRFASNSVQAIVVTWLLNAAVVAVSFYRLSVLACSP